MNNQFLDLLKPFLQQKQLMSHQEMANTQLQNQQIGSQPLGDPQRDFLFDPITNKFSSQEVLPLPAQTQFEQQAQRERERGRQEEQGFSIEPTARRQIQYRRRF